MKPPKNDSRKLAIFFFSFAISGFVTMLVPAKTLATPMKNPYAPYIEKAETIIQNTSQVLGDIIK